MKRVLVLLPLAGLLAAGCGGQSDSTPKAGTGSGTASGPPTAQTFTIHGTDAQTFEPATVRAKVGRLTLTLESGGVPHNLTFADPSLPGISAVSGAVAKSTVLTFNRPGTYAFSCTIHPGMNGKVVVG